MNKKQKNKGSSIYLLLSIYYLDKVERQGELK